MKKAILFLGVYFFLMASTPFHAQVIRGKKAQVKFRNSIDLSITSPKNKSKVSSPLTISGTAPKETTVSIKVKAIYSGGDQGLGTFTATASNNGKWQSTPVNLWAPEGSKNLRFEIIVTDNSRTDSEKKISVSTNQPIQMISRVEMTEKKFRALNPKLTLVPQEVPSSKVERRLVKQPAKMKTPVKVDKKLDVGNTLNLDLEDTETRIISPPQISSFTKIPVVFGGTAKRNSDIELMITTTYKENGEAITKRTKTNLSTDNKGEWGRVKLYSIKVDKADGKVTHDITAVRKENGKEVGNKATRTIYSEPTTKTMWKPIPNVKLKVTLLEIQCAVSKDDDKIDDYGITQHVKYKANGKIKSPISRDIKKFRNNRKCKPGDQNSYWAGSTALICGNRDRQIQVQESKVTDRRSPNINNSVIFEITPDEANDRNAEFTIDTWIKEYSSTTLSNILVREDYDNVLNKDPRKMRVAIYDVLAILNGTKDLNASHTYFDGDVSQSLKFDNFDNASLPLRKVSYSGRTILEGPIRGRMRNAHNNRKAFVWMRFELVD
ncbi:hypothetical protein [Gelidibacter maritimus]|uniref:Uncharacterized protein n=1 Tax=Gelidibacter maritimus TaxID=2761487 RepID=A0A7W2M3I9_9FLAO|nr:hypothetical protein [Gelidibacter maritimus]MBA6152010.1 hypothetical protein [Gelidibacter maritimus]